MALRWLDAWRRRSAGAASDGASDVDGSALHRVRALVTAGCFHPALATLHSLDESERAQPALQLLAGVACAHLGRNADALAALRAGMAAALVDAIARDALLDALVLLGAGADIEALARDVAAQTAFDARLGLVMGRCSLARAAPRDAETWLRRAVELAPGVPAAWSALGLALRHQDRDADALAAYEAAERATAAGGGEVEAFADVAYMLQRMGQFQQARMVLESQLPGRPSIGAHRGYAEVLLTQGELPAGFEHYEFRWMAEPLAGTRLGPVRPPWIGQPLAGKTVLLRIEQGYGDTFQFLRYAEHVKRLGATVVMRRFCELVDEMPQVDIALRDIDAVPHIDYYANLGSLPRVFATTLNTIPAEVPYLRVPAAKRDAWQARIAPFDGLNVGLAWAGNALPDPRRSIVLADLRPLLDVPGVRFYGLQKGPTDVEVSAATSGRIHPLGTLLVDFADTAAAIESLDLVISIDTSVAHLAGALGKPVWTMLMQNADWRWMADREDSPWYPTMRLFRQERRGAWAPVIERVARALADVVEGRQPLATSARGDARVDRALAMPSLAEPARCSRPIGRVVETRYGIVHHRGDDSLESRALDCYGEHAQAQLERVERLLEPGAVVVDIAPGAGAHALALASVLGAAGWQVLVERRAFERRLLRQNLRANRADAAATVLDALPGRLDLPEALGLARLDLLKIGDGVDAVQALADVAPLIWRFRPPIFAALVDERATASVADALRQFGYCAWRISAPLWHAANFFGRPDDVFGGRCALAVLAGPEESARPLLDEPPMLAY